MADKPHCVYVLICVLGVRVAAVVVVIASPSNAQQRSLTQARTHDAVHIIMKLNAWPNGLPYGWRIFARARWIRICAPIYDRPSRRRRRRRCRCPCRCHRATSVRCAARIIKRMCVCAACTCVSTHAFCGECAAASDRRPPQNSRNISRAHI